MWTPYKELQSLVEKYLISVPDIQDPQYHELTEALRNHRQNFLTILKKDGLKVSRNVCNYTG